MDGNRSTKTTQPVPASDASKPIPLNTGGVSSGGEKTRLVMGEKMPN